MKPVPLKIEVPNPCSEPWDKMQSTDGGKYCGSCEKHVTDFSRFTDQELISYFKNRNAESCGRFRKDQLQRELHQTIIQKGTLKPRNYWLAGVLGFTGLTLQGQTSDKAQHEICQQIKPTLVFEGTSTYAFVGTHFHGQAVNAENHPLPYAIITYFQDRASKGIIADGQGRFTIQLENTSDSFINLTIASNALDNQHISMIQEMKTLEIHAELDPDNENLYTVGRLPFFHETSTLTSYRRKGLRAFFYKLFHLRKWIKYKKSLRLAK
jgi:hypothetical protein